MVTKRPYSMNYGVLRIYRLNASPKKAAYTCCRLEKSSITEKAAPAQWVFSLKTFSSHLTLAPKDVAIIDTEAGVEHLGRGVADSVDLILGIIDPSYESIKLSEKISAMAKESKKPIHFIINKAEGTIADKIIAKVGKKQVIGVIAFSPFVQEKGLTRRST